MSIEIVRIKQNVELSVDEFIGAYCICFCQRNGLKMKKKQVKVNHGMVKDVRRDSK